MSMRGLSSEDERSATGLLIDAERNASTPFEFAVVKLLALIVWAIARSES